MEITRNDILYKYLSVSDFYSEDYIVFLKQYYGESDYQTHYNRTKWYVEHGCIKILAAVYKNTYMGQSCAYSVQTHVLGKVITLNWGVDSFVISIYRGLGIGKRLQKKLHEDVPNFTSFWYSPTNGHIKRICGSHELFKYKMMLYPLSGYLKYFMDAFCLKVLKKEIKFTYKSDLLKRIFFGGKSNYIFREIEFSEELYGYIEKALSKYDFYVLRNVEYINWKYNNNPSMNFNLIEVLDADNIRCALVFITLPNFIDVMASRVNCVKVLDVFKTDMKFTERDLISLLCRYFQANNWYVDCILKLGNEGCFPHIVFPWPSTTMLSTITDCNIKNPYISYSDQDMEQMY